MNSGEHVIANRLLFDHRLAHEIARSVRTGDVVAVFGTFRLLATIGKTALQQTIGAKADPPSS